MDAKKRKKLEAAGWQVGTVEDFLNLTSAELAMVELRLSLGEALKKRREQKSLT